MTKTFPAPLEASLGPSPLEAPFGKEVTRRGANPL
jgi:hypothetical protein